MARLIAAVLIGQLFTQLVSSYSMKKLESSSEALFLTPYIERGDFVAGREASSAESLLDDDTVSYSGLFTVNKTYNSNMFFWFFPAEKDSADAPFIVWLSGGPGVSSVSAVFELGPYNLDKNQTLSKRHLSWTQKYNVMFIDNPVGTGFSFTDQDDGYSTSETDIGNNLYSTVTQFFKLFPEYKKNDFYIAGSSYAGKYVPALGYTIDINEKNKNENEKINLKGLIIGNGFSDPATIVQRSDILYNTGMIGPNFKVKLDSYLEIMMSLINQGKYVETKDINDVMRKELAEQTGYSNLFNLLFDSVQYPIGNVTKLMSLTDVKRKLNVGNRTFMTNRTLYIYLRGEIFQSVKPWVEDLLEKYKLLMYSGQLDIEIPYIQNSKYLQSLKWSGAEEFKKAERKLWRIDNKLVGYTQTGGKLSEVLVRNAGHAVHIEKPQELLNLLNDFINNSL